MEKNRWQLRALGFTGILTCFLLMETGYSHGCVGDAPGDQNSTEHIITIQSNGFNARKRSSFTLQGETFHPSRGLTIVHFNSSEKYESRSFDTHGDEAEASKFIETLKLLEQNKATYILLAHDSASKSLSKFSPVLKEMGFEVLSSIGSRQAYVMYNFNDRLQETVDDLSIRLEIPIPAGIIDTKQYFPKESLDFEPSNDRYIAHAGGEVNGVKSTNTKEALDQNYEKGFRLFELDIIETTDGKFVAAHDWNMWSRFTDYGGELPVSLAEFKKHKIYGKYNTLDMQGINSWFAAHPDAILITDKINEPVRFASKFVDKSRLIMELFSPMALEEASRNNISAMISQKPLTELSGDKISYLIANKIKHVAISRRIIARKTRFLQELQKQGIRVYVYHVNFDPGKDEKYVLENEIGLVYGMYADKWAFGEQEAQ